MLRLSRRTVIWLAAAVTALVVAAALIVATADYDEDDDLSPASLPSAPVFVGSVDVDVTQTNTGFVVQATIRISADRPVRLKRLFVQVRNSDENSQDPTGRSYDLGAETGPTTVTTTPTDFSRSTSTNYTAGTYGYNLAYVTGRRTVMLPPYSTFKVA